jgi:predicted nuclease of predicted toxin-antitoxin system
MARIYSNENFPFPVVEKLRSLGHDVLTTQENGRANQRVSDVEVRDFAVRDNRIILTLNRRHFVEIHNANSSHCGIVVCSLDNDFEALSQRIHNALSEMTDMKDRLIRIDRPAR